MKGLFLKLFFLNLFVFAIVSYSVAQRSNGLTIEGKISNQEGLVQGAIIQMVQDGKRIDDYGIGSDGKYKLELNYNHKFELTFVLKGNFSQKILVDTNVPRTILQTDPLFPPFPVNINLFTEIAGIDKSFAENAVLKIYYRDQVDNFVSDIYYNDAQIKRLIDQAILQSQMVNREADYLSKLTKAELAELKKEYDQLLKEADAEYGNEKFLNALDGYKAANQVFPSEQYPKDRIAEINDLLGLMMVAEEMDKALAERFNSLIAAADGMFNAKQYFDARNSYNRALSIRPADNHASQRVKQIDDILSAQQTEQQYQDLIVSGNNAFNELLYEAALKNYTDASVLKPDEEYPKTKIREINAKLGELSKNLENQKSYDQAIFQAELNFEKQFYDKALASYENALVFKPGDSKATTKIGEIKELMNRLANRTLFDKLVDSADKNFKKDLFTEALTDYRKANELFPDEAYPAQQIAVINEKLNADASFLAAVNQADQAFTGKQYQIAKDLYNQVLAIRSNHKHSSDRIVEINRILASLSVDENYNTLIADADQLFSGRNYNEAKNKYSEALALKVREQYPKDKIAEINTILRDLAAVDQKYQQTVNRADNLFNSGKYGEAKPVYAEAGTIKPNETYPPEMMGKIDSLLDEQARLLAQKEAEEKARLVALSSERDKNYQSIIDEADRMVVNNQLVEAVGKFRSALDIKPNEQYPIQRIEEIRGIIARQQEILNAYNAAIARADAEFGKESYDAAKTAYNTAKSAKPDETYPDEMIARIDSVVEARARLAKEAADAEAARLAALQAEKDRQYNEAIAKADGFFNGKEYENARTEYRSALTVKPGEIYPQQKIDEIGNLLAQLSASQKAYESAIAAGDREFGREVFEAAKTAYNTAKSAKPDETYPDEMIAKIDSVVEARARLAKEAADAEAARLAALQAEKDRQYNEAIAKADGLFNGKEYENARTEYRSALSVKPDETYPQQRIDEIGNLLVQLSASQKAYESAIAAGDREFGREAFEAAKTAYNTAKSAKPDETYPDEMIARIDSLVEARARLAKEAADAEAARLAALQAEKDRQYNEAIAKADGFFNGKEYEKARTEYRSALSVKPGEIYPQQKIDEIGNLLTQLSASQKAYESAIAAGDREFGREAFEAAKTAYNTAKSAKPDETYPDEMIAKIDSLVEARARLAKEAADAEAARLAALQAEKDRQYNEAIAKADGFFNGKEYENARTEYRSALSVKPDETYPQQKIAEINALIEQLAQSQREQEIINRNYENAIQLADNYFKSNNYTQARTNYEKASGLKPGEDYPKQKITEIDGLLQQQQIDENYRKIILAADGYFNTTAYNEAKTEYEKALNVKPNEQYPKNQIQKINDIFQKEQDRILAEQQAAADLERRRNEIQQQNEEVLEQEIVSQAGLDGLYNEYIREADTRFDSREYNVSRGWYYKAWDVKPEETYPPQRIAEINRLVSGLLSTQRDRDYQNFINLGDSTFRDNQLAVARGWYNQALSIKATEPYPRDQLNEIERLVNERLAGRSGEMFNGHVEKAEAAFVTGSYSVARFWFKKALELRPDDSTVKSRLSEIEEALK